MIRKVFLIFITVIIIIQFVRPVKNSGDLISNGDIRKKFNLPDQVLHTFERSCYDCHSDHTEYKWYADVQPVGWFLANHITEGKRELNFSQFKSYNSKKADHKLEEIAEVVTDHSMPLSSYLWLHPDASLSQTEITAIKKWVAETRLLNVE